MAAHNVFPKVSAQTDFPELDKRILDFWDSIDAFATSIESRSAESEYTFYDGPPFATGSPHYGHILQGIIKDIVPRYWTMRGCRVERRFGWDTHGLPVEMEVEKQLGVSGPREIAEIGVDTFNEACRAMVNNITEDWYDITRRIGRWVDFDNDYKTMDTDFMESVWWVFKQLWDRGYIYQDFKVLPYSYGATTPLSNFEANLDYRDVDDPAITVRVSVNENHGPVSEGDWLVFWTTTPWTVPSNLAMSVGENIEYARVTVPNEDRRYWVAKDLIETVFGEHAAVDATAAGTDLIGARYDPPFDYFIAERDNGAFTVIASPEVTTAEGTGLVHLAPAYGEADFLAMQSAGLTSLVDPVDAKARFTEEVPDVAGLNVKDADATLIELLSARGALVNRSTIRHSYPFCWRTGTPLIYKAIPTWFVAVEQFRDRMVEVNKDILWVPAAIGERRFGNWLEGARDWAISRNRYWGSAIPVWECDECGEQVAIGSREELFDLSGKMLDDLHKHIVDLVTFSCSACDGTMTRIPEVLDCWFESGSMPFAQIHYPFENEQRFEDRFPADFIAEGLDQTRGWFYTLLVLSTAIRDEAPFQNCIVTGMVVAEDGRKMSKSLKNYPDPSHVIDAFGADALRAYLINSPLVRGEPLRFAESGVREVVRTVLLPLWNSYSFFTTYAEVDDLTPEDLADAPRLSERPEIDRWIMSVLQSLIADVNTEMEAYRLYSVVPPIIEFVGHLTNWYIRRSRRRFWSHRGTDNDADKLAAFATLYEVLTTFSGVAAPILPFVTEEIYQGLVRTVEPDAPVSVHHTDYPTAERAAIDEDLETAMAIVRTVVNLGRGLRKRHDARVRQPLHTVTIVTRSQTARRAVSDHASLISEELNVRSVEIHSDEAGLVDLEAKANFKVLGPRLGKDMKAVAGHIAALDHETIAALLDGGSFEVGGLTITLEDIVVVRTPRAGTIVATERELSVALDTTIDDDLRIEGIARELINRVQAARRQSGFDVTDRIVLRWMSDDDSITEAFARHRDLIAGEVLATDIETADLPDADDIEVTGAVVRLELQPIVLEKSRQDP
ncbi:MAG: isoleucine--tRNA ligase [Acidimicrobiia bacterium]|nr:MAG: isoleucine--tRNA ligase [Acidimicrobiia bacterium]